MPLSGLRPVAVLLCFCLTLAAGASVRWEPLPLVSQGIRDRGFSGGEGGQQVMSIGAAEDGSLYLFGTDVGGLFRSFDGINWEPANIGFRARGGYAIAFDPAAPENILVLGGSKNDFHNNTTGVYLSRDRGLTWTRVLAQSRETEEIGNLVFDPTTKLPDGRSRRAYFSGGSTGLHRSDDGGQTWAVVNAAFTRGHLGVNRANGRLYLANSTGFYTSDDFGVTFVQRRANHVRGLSAPPAGEFVAPGTVYITEGQTIQVSTDDGVTFAPIPTSSGFSFQTGDNLTHIAVNPENPQQILVNRWRGQYYDNRAFSTRNGGATWTQLVFNHQNAFLPYNGRPTPFVWVASQAWAEGGDWVTRSVDGGATFAWSANGYNGIMLGSAFTFSPTNPDVVMVGTQDYDASLTTNGGLTWTYLNMSGNGWGGYIYGAHASESGIRFGGNATSWGGTRTLRVFRNGSWVGTGLTFTGLDICTSAPGDSKTLFASNWRSTDGGATWADMTAAEHLVKCHGVLTHDPLTGALFGTARITGGSQLVRSTDKGATWAVVATVSGRILDCAYDHVRRRAWITVENLNTNQTRDLMFTTLDVNGVGTTPVLASPYPPNDTGLFSGRARINTVAVDPTDPNILYLGSSRDTYRADNSVIRSLDGGASWENLTLRAAPTDGRRQGPSEATWVRVHPTTRHAWFATNCYGLWKLAPPDFVAAVDSTPIHVSLPVGVSLGYPLTITNTTALSQTFRATLPGTVGYTASTSNSTDADKPAYVWNDLVGLTGTVGITELNNQNDATTQYVNGQSGAQGAIPLGFTFPLFGETYTGVWVSSNGTLHFGSRPGTATAANVALPAPTFGASIFFLWDDLRLYNNRTPASRAYFRRPSADTFVMQYTAVRQNSGNTAPLITLQVQLSASGEILMTCKDLTLLANSTYTIGAQNSDRTRFYQYSHNTYSVAAGQALRLRPLSQWALPLSANIDLAAGATQDHVLTFSSIDRAPGTYTSTLTVQPLSGALPAVNIPVTLTVRADTAMEAWRRAEFGHPLPTEESLDLADPDEDGMSNLLEFALGGNPHVADATARLPVVTTGQDGRVALSFRRERDAADVTYLVEASSDLVNWTVIATNPGAVGQQVTVPDVVAAGAEPRRFLRLRVSAP
jgi:hypothetical protein